MISPLEAEQKNLIADLTKKNAERLVANKKLQDLIEAGKKDPDAENLAILKSIRSKLIEVQAVLASSTANLIKPKDMPKILETVLHNIGGLTLVRPNSLGLTPLITKDEPDQESKQKHKKEKENKSTAENLDNANGHWWRSEVQGDC